MAQFSICAKELKLPSITEVPELKKETMLKDLDIPAVRDRDPDPNAGPRLSVKEFRLQGIVEYPELGITRNEIGKIVEDIRFDMMGEGKLLESGYTLEELSQVSDLMADIESEVKDRHVGPLEVQKLVWLVREQMSKRGVTLGMIETVADRITRYYRQHGFILAKAYIPQQQVRDGVVTLSLLLGVLGEIQVNNSELYQDKWLSDAFSDVMTKPVTSDAIEERLFLLNDYPGLVTQGFFEAGSQVGDTRLNINVRAQDWYTSNLRVDNHGTDETGKNRLYAEFLWNNPTGTTDQLHFGALAASGESKTTYGQIRYKTNIFGPRINTSIGYASNAFVLGRTDSEAINALDIEGETNISDFTLKYKMKRSRVENYSINFGYENIESIIRLGGISGIMDDEVNNAYIGFDFEMLQETKKMLHQGNLRIKSGEFVVGQDGGQDESYSMLLADYSLLTFWTIPFTEIETRAIIRASLQYTDDILSSVNRFSLGGPTRARAFEAKVFSADSGIYAGLDLFFNAPDFMDVKIGDGTLKDMIAPFVFIDFAYGEAKSLASSSVNAVASTKAEIANYGVGLQFSFSSDLSAKLQISSSAREEYRTPDGFELDTGESDAGVLFELQYKL
ncbi:ShlB/FhaC/HecB family hemolysin secretion/activation protein [Aliikangiella sp. G2MR2-5]|uniref:ShlB/FhaC/HecB family hemolysin secretion/activation protein n=1 Tax=Aliikangiella sp. G2MR2-5 TaxID=2788943 RepID=UPI0018AA0337|nr:ShlB/FhaC/HecB family hemolysin secretion/activation protein [Aliikangiella sp. G2MR2-5]